MNRIWIVTVFSMRDALRRRIWYTSGIGVVLAGALAFMQFPSGFQNPYAENIISSFFFFWAWGALGTALIMGATGIPNERQAQVLFTLPIDRWQLFLGKLIAAQLLTGAFLVAGYGVSRLLAVQQGLEATPYAKPGLVAALAASFVCLCVSVPLGAWLSPASSALIAFITLTLGPVLDVYVAAGLIGNSSLVKAARIAFPWGIDTRGMNNAFWESGNLPADYAGLAWSVFLAFGFFLALTAICRRRELSMKWK